MLKNIKKDYTQRKKIKNRTCIRLQSKLWPVVAKPIVVEAHKCLDVLTADSNLVSSALISNISRMAEAATVTNERMIKPP